MFSIIKFRDIEEVAHYLNGGVLGDTDLRQGVTGLVGETLAFTAPAFSVTFVDALGRPPGFLLFKDIKAQIEAANVHILVLQFVGGRIGFIEKTPASGVTLDPAASDAKTLLGLPKGICTGRIIKQMYSPAPPRLENMYQVMDGTHVVTVWEGN